MAVVALMAIASPAVTDAQAPDRDQRARDPVVVEEPGDRDERLGRDPFGAMGGGSPFCHRSELAAVERHNCRASGAVSHPVRIDHYGFDVHIDTGVDNVAGNFAKGLQDIAQMAWMVLLYLVKGTTLGLEWAFSLDLLGKTMPGARDALARIHGQVIGDGWLFAAISAAGLWAIYRGLVQGRTSETFAGLGATVALMLVGLVIVGNPAETVGRASDLTNQAALGIVSGATSGSAKQPVRGFGEAMTRVFDQAVLRPWCALEFSDVRFCLSAPRQAMDRDDLPDDPDVKAAYEKSATVADMFLAFEPNGEDEVDQRNRIYETWKDKQGDRLQAVVRIQKEASTGPRLALLAVIAIGQLGMILLFGWLAMRLLGYGGLALCLLLVAPVVLLAPALGESGRAAFAAWAKRLAGAVVAKAVYAVVLAVVLLATGALAELDSLGWIAVWLFQGVVWWTLFLKRDEIIGLVTSQPAGRDRTLLQRAFYAHRLASTARDIASGGTSAIARQTAGRVLQRRATTAAAVQSASDRALRSQAASDLGRRDADAREAVTRDAETKHDLRRVNAVLKPYDGKAKAAKRAGAPPPRPSSVEATLLAHRDYLQTSRPSRSEVAGARDVLAHGDRNEANGDGRISDRDERAYIRRRRREIDALPLDHDRNLRAAGIDPEHYRASEGVERERLRTTGQLALERERRRLDAAPTGREAQPTGIQISKARATFASAEVRAARREENRARRARRRQARLGGVPERRYP